MTVLETIRIIGKEFSDVWDEVIEQYITVYRPMVSKNRFGKLFNLALAYLVCHKLKMDGHGENPLGDLGAIGVVFAVGSVSEGGSSISFGASQSSNLAADAEYGLTTYGLQYLQLRRMAIIPIHISGETPTPEPDEVEGVNIMPIASYTTLGGVKVSPGSGLTISPDVELSLENNPNSSG